MNIEEYESLPSTSIGVHMTAGAFAGIMEHCVMYPLDSVKTRMQALTPSPGNGGGVSAVLSGMVRQEGLLRPIRGMSAMIIGAGPAHALYFSCYEFLKDKFVSHKTPQFNHIVYGAAGCVATLLHDGVMNPAEVVKQRLQMYKSPYRNALDCVQHILKTEGFIAFYRSYTTQLAMNIPFQCIHFISYEFGQSITNPEHVYNPAAHVASGAMAGAVSAAVTTPLDVCKTLLNTQQGNVQPQGMVEAVKAVYRYGGLKGFFRGLRARIIHQMPATAICWSTYEFFKYMLKTTRDDDNSLMESEEVSVGTSIAQSTNPRSSSLQDAGIYLNKIVTTPALLGVGRS